MRYLTVDIFFETDDELDQIVNGLRTTIEREPIVAENGISYTLIENDEELMNESFCLGLCYMELEQQGIEYPFEIGVVELDEPPKKFK
jgi:hypothetical protein